VLLTLEILFCSRYALRDMRSQEFNRLCFKYNVDIDLCSLWYICSAVEFDSVVNGFDIQ